MTDEEKAEKYVKEQILKHNRDVVLRPKNAVTYIDELKQAHLDGLAEGRKEKWHDLRKDPNDLPKESGDYWCKLKEQRRYAFEVYYKDSLFYKSKSRWEELGIIAWCELPEFEEI